MKKIRVVQTIGLVLFVVYIFFVVYDATTGIVEELQIILFSLIMALISLNLIAKGVIIKSSSTLWFAITLILFSIAMIIMDILQLKQLDNYYIFSLIPIISSVINLAIFKNLIYIKVIILNISVFLPILINHVYDLRTWLVIFIGIISVIFGVFVCRYINITKENE